MSLLFALMNFIGTPIVVYYMLNSRQPNILLFLLWIAIAAWLKPEIYGFVFRPLFWLLESGEGMLETGGVAVLIIALMFLPALAVGLGYLTLGILWIFSVVELIALYQGYSRREGSGRGSI